MAYGNVGPESGNQESLESKPLLYYRNFKYLIIGIYVIGPGDGNKLPVRVKRMSLVSCIDSVSSPLSLSPDSRPQRAPPQFSLQYVCSYAYRFFAVALYFVRYAVSQTAGSLNLDLYIFQCKQGN